jgi:hypothetical protein
VNRRVDPTAALRKEYGKRVRDDSAAPSLWKKHHLAVRESANKACRQEAIFAKEQQIFLVQRGDFALAILVDNLGFDDQRNPVISGSFPSFETEHRETAGET